MASKGGPKKEGIVGVIVLAIASSKLKSLADKNTLKAVVMGQYPDLVKEGTIHLEVLWKLLKDLPGFSEKDAVEPFCLVKTWESDFELKVELPPALSSLSSSAITSAASKCSVSSRLKTQALFPDTVVEEPRSKSSNSKGKRGTVASKASKGKGGKAKGGSKGLVTLLALVVLGGGGYTAFTMLGGDANAVAIDAIAPDLPISSATRDGAELSLRLKGDDWFTRSKEDRKAGMEATLRSVNTIDIETVMVYDSVGNYRASARWFGNPPVIAIRLK